MDIRSPITRIERDALKHAFKHLWVFLLWNLVVSLGLLLIPAPGGLLVALPATAAVLWGYLLGGRRPVRRWARLRLRPLTRRALYWTLGAVPALLLFTSLLGEVYVRLVPVPPEAFDPFERTMGTPAGRLSISLLAVAIAPVLEEFFFRGLIQHRLERRWGAAVGIGATATLFAVIHFLPWLFPLHFFLGLAFGYAVYATRSIWSAVVLHAANNAATMLGLGLQEAERTRPPTLWESGPTSDWWISLAALAVAGYLIVVAARGLWVAGRGARLRRAAGDE